MINKYLFFTSVFICLITVYILNLFTNIDKKISFGSNFWIGYEPAYIGDYRDRLDIKLIEYPSASETLRAFQNKTIDIAGVTLDEAITLADKGVKFKILLIADISDGADGVLSQKEIKNLSQIDGKIIGFEDTALGSYVLSRLFEIADINTSDIIKVPIEASEHIKYFKENLVDVIITFEPIKTQLINLGANLLFDSKVLKNEIVDIIIVQSEFYEKNKIKLEKFKSIWFESRKKVLKFDVDTIKILSKKHNLNENELKTIISTIKYPDENESDFILNQKILNISSKLLDIMSKNNLIEHKIKIDEFLIKKE